MPVTFEDPLNVELDVLNREFLQGSARMRNAEIAKEISKLNGAREVDTSNVRTWMIKKRRKVDEQASGTNSECKSYLKFESPLQLATHKMCMQVRRLELML